MRKAILFFISLFCTILSCGAQNGEIVDIITTQNGDRFSGYISEQFPGKSVKIVAFKIEMTVPGDRVKCSGRQERFLSDYPEFAAFFPDKRQDETFEMCTIKVLKEDGKLQYTFAPAALLVSGATVSFASLDRHEFDIPVKDIKLSQKTAYSTYNGHLWDEIRIASDFLKGQWLQEDCLSGEVLFKKDDGSTLSSQKSKITFLSHKTDKNEESEFWEQLPYLDKVCLKNGLWYEGFTETVFFGQHIQFKIRGDEDGTSKLFKLSDILRYEKRPNPSYVRVEPVVQEEILSDLYINGISQPMYEFVEEGARSVVAIDVDSIKTCVNAGSQVVIRLKTEARTSQMRVAQSIVEKEKVYGVTGWKIKQRQIEYRPVVTQKDILTQPDINFRHNDGEYMESDIVFTSPGVYVLWIEGSSKCIAINVK